MTLTTVLGEHPEVRLIEFLAKNGDLDYTITELSRHTGVSRPAAYRSVARFLEAGVLRKTRRVGASQFYRLDLESPMAKPFVELQHVLASQDARRRRPRRSP